MIGQTISHYKILEKLGEGGMGVVYKAEDTKLDREVALKFLPHHISSSDVDRARFLQEAKAAAVLNHPNICTIHDIAEDAGEQFIVMEFVDGVTMKDKFSPAPLKLNDAVNYAIQIGEALQEAHSKGIVHRDVKSENIMVNSKNQVKVMDFGLAKLRGSVKLTKSSSTTGTLAYMAPEQIQGSDTDARADIFSFGVVLYEMLTGHTPFRGEHEAAMMYSIINEEPQPIQKFRDDLSSEMLHILNRALEKDPEERYQTVKDMTIDLRRLKKESTRIVRTTSTFVVADEEKEVRQVSGGSKKSNKTLWMGIGVTGLLAAILVLWFFGRSPELNPQMILRVLQIPFTQIGYPGMSPDGKWIAFPAASADNRWDIYFMNTLGGEPRRITSDSAIYMQSTDISPDGSLIAYDKATSPTDIAIYAVPSLGGISTKIADGGGLPRWRPDGKRIGFITLKLSDFWSVNTDGNDKKLEFTDSISFNAAGQLTRVSFSWSPDGNSVAWLTTFSSYQEIFIWDLISHRSRQLTFDKKNIDEVCWMPNNQIVFSSNRGGNTNLWVIPAKGGQAVQLTKGSGPDLGIRGSWDNKSLIYMQQQRIGNLWLAGMDGTGAHQLTFGDQFISNPDISPDGSKIIFQMSEADPLKALEQTIHIINRDGSGQKSISPRDLAARVPRWSPDGKWIAYHARIPSEPVDSSTVYLIDAKNPGSAKPIGRGGSVFWIDDSSLVAYRFLNSWLTFIDGSPQEHFFEDSTSAYPISGTPFILFFYNYSERQGNAYRIRNGEPLEKAEKLLALVFNSFAITGRNHYYVTPSNEFYRCDVVTGKHVKINGTFPGLDLFSSGWVREDEEEIVYTNVQNRTKLVLIEDLFK